MVKRVPHSNYQRIGLCRLNIKKGRYFKAIELLKKIDEKKLERLNFILYNFCKSDLYKKSALYNKALFYLKRANHKIGNRIEKSWILIHLVDILRRVGNYNKAEALLYDYKNNFGELYDLEAILWEIKISQRKWDEAKSIEEKIRKKFGYFGGEKTETIEKRFKNSDRLWKIWFYERYLNFEKALEILNLIAKENKISPFEVKLKRAELLFELGDRKKAKSIIESLLKENLSPEELIILSDFFSRNILIPELSIKFLEKLKLKVKNQKAKEDITKKIEYLKRFKGFFKKPTNQSADF